MSEKTESTTPWLDIAVDVRSPIPYMQQCMRDAVLAFNSKHESPPSTSGTDRSHLTERRSGPRVKLRLSLGNDPACRFQVSGFSFPLAFHNNSFDRPKMFAFAYSGYLSRKLTGSDILSPKTALFRHSICGVP